jgi:ubiquinone/menaquinone biosynthesis C-methylase UbiE
MGPRGIDRRLNHWCRLAVAAALLGAASASAEPQLASRPVDEWRKLLDAPERIAALKTDEVIARLKLRPADIVADLGSGTGPFVVPFAKAVPSGVVYAVEVDKGFLPLIADRTRTAGITNVHTVLGGFTDPRLPASVDLAFMHDVLHHIEDRAAYVAALSRYLTPTARVAVIDFKPERSPHQDQPALLVSKEHARALFAKIGLKPIEDIALFDDKWFVVFGR